MLKAVFTDDGVEEREVDSGSLRSPKFLERFSCFRRSRCESFGVGAGEGLEALAGSDLLKIPGGLPFLELGLASRGCSTTGGVFQPTT